MRLRHRYYVCQLEFDADAARGVVANTGDIFSAVRAQVLETFGDAGWGAIAAVFAVKYYSPVTRLCVLRSTAGFDGRLRAAVATVKTVKKTAAAVHVLQVAGSARTLRAYLLHWHRTLADALAADPAAVGLDTTFFSDLEADIPQSIVGKGR